MIIFNDLIRAHQEAIAPHVAGKLVHDLGAGDLTRSSELVRLGAQVVAVDKEPMPEVTEGGKASLEEFHKVVVFRDA